MKKTPVVTVLISTLSSPVFADKPQVDYNELADTIGKVSSTIISSHNKAVSEMRRADADVAIAREEARAAAAAAIANAASNQNRPIWGPGIVIQQPPRYVPTQHSPEYPDFSNQCLGTDILRGLRGGTIAVQTNLTHEPGRNAIIAALTPGVRFQVISPEVQCEDLGGGAVQYRYISVVGNSQLTGWIAVGSLDGSGIRPSVN